jgi:hypothetical protein
MQRKQQQQQRQGSQQLTPRLREYDHLQTITDCAKLKLLDTSVIEDYLQEFGACYDGKGTCSFSDKLKEWRGNQIRSSQSFKLEFSVCYWKEIEKECMTMKNLKKNFTAKI